MQLDECIPLPSEYKEMERAMELSLRWAQRCKDAFGHQPGTGAARHRAGRRQCRAAGAFGGTGLKSIGFKGYSIGGLAVGEPQEVMFRRARRDHLPSCRPTSRAT
jgi:queuine tRNA-ribosyltransferase